MAKADLEDAGEETDEYCDSTSKMQAAIKGLSGVDILTPDQQSFKSTYEIKKCLLSTKVLSYAR